MIRVRKIAGPLLGMVVLGLALSCCPKAHAFNLWQDVKEQTQWTLGSVASAGTAVALKNEDGLDLKAGDFVPSFLASITQYRMFSLWWGGNSFKLADGTTVIKDTAKIGFNLAYVFRGFVNQPPTLLQNLVVGPSVSFNVVTAPRYVIPFLDINYAFGQPATAK